MGPWMARRPKPSMGCKDVDTFAWSHYKVPDRQVLQQQKRSLQNPKNVMNPKAITTFSQLQLSH